MLCKRFLFIFFFFFFFFQSNILISIPIDLLVTTRWLERDVGSSSSRWWRQFWWKSDDCTWNFIGYEVCFYTRPLCIFWNGGFVCSTWMMYVICCFLEFSMLHKTQILCPNLLYEFKSITFYYWSKHVGVFKSLNHSFESTLKTYSKSAIGTRHSSLISTHNLFQNNQHFSRRMNWICAWKYEFKSSSKKKWRRRRKTLH